MSKRLAKRFHCPDELTLAVLDGKWKTAIMRCLELRSCRYADLRKQMPQVSDKMLSERLRDLINAGLVVRDELAGARTTRTYTLSPLGRSLGALLNDLSLWAIAHAEALGVDLRAATPDSGGPLTADPSSRGLEAGHLTANRPVA